MLNFVYAEKWISEKGLRYGQKKKVRFQWQDDSFSAAGSILFDCGNTLPQSSVRRGQPAPKFQPQWIQWSPQWMDCEAVKKKSSQTIQNPENVHDPRRLGKTKFRKPSHTKSRNTHNPQGFPPNPVKSHPGQYSLSSHN